MRMKLTDQAINKAARDAEADGKRRELADVGCPGLRIRVTSTGGRSWILGARDKLGKARRFSLGSYPAMGISAAREAARAMHHKVKQEGADPIAEKRRNVAIGKQSKAGVGTLKALLDTYEAHGSPPKSWYPGRPRVELVFRAGHSADRARCCPSAICNLKRTVIPSPNPPHSLSGRCVRYSNGRLSKDEHTSRAIWRSWSRPRRSKRGNES